MTFLYDYKRDGILKPGEVLFIYEDGDIKRVKEGIGTMQRGTAKTKQDTETAGVIQYIDGWAWGIAADGSTICLGREANVKAAIANPKAKSGYPNIDQVIELERELIKDGEGNDRQPNIQRPGAFRSRTTGKAKRGATHIKSVAFRKRLPGGKTKR